MKIYTKTGDLGETGLLGGQRVSKADLRVETYGNLDELTAFLALASSLTNDEELKKTLTRIQIELFHLSSELATPSDRKPYGPLIPDDAVEQLEKEIDACDEELPPLKTFILQGGSPTSAYLQVARTVCRRAERSIVRLHQTEPVRPLIIKYVNRLSDLLFALARRANFREGFEDIPIS